MCAYRFRRALVVALAAMLLASGAAAGAAAAPVELRFAGFCAEDGTVGNMFFPRLDQFLSDNPDIRIVNDYAYDDDLKAKIKSEAAADSLPDIMAYWATLANSSWLYASDMIVPTQQLADGVDGVDMDMIDQSIIRTTSYDGVSYGIPLNTLRMCFTVNKAIYQECGVKLPTEYPTYTYEQFREDGKVFLEKGYIPVTIGYKGGNPGHYWLAELVSQLPGGLDELYGIMQYQAPTSADNLQKAMTYIQDDIAMGLYPQDFLNASWSEMHALYCDRRAAAMYTITSSAAPLMVEDPQLLADSLVVPFPQIDGCVSPPASRVARSVNWSLHVSQKSWADPAKKDAICRFLSWFFAQDWQTAYATTEEPALTFGFDISGSFGPFYQQVLTVQDGWSYSPYYLCAVPDSGVFTAFKDNIMEAATLSITPEQFAQRSLDIFAELENLD